MTSSPGSTRPRIAYSITPLPPTVTNTCDGSAGDALARGHVRGDRLAQRRDAGERRVVGRALVERPLGRLADVGRRVEIGLADLEVDDRPALGLERAGAGADLERALGADRAHPGGDACGRDETDIGVDLLAASTAAASGSRRSTLAGPLGQPAHVPRIPGLTVGDERLDAVAGLGESILLPRRGSRTASRPRTRRVRHRPARPARRSAR